MSNRLTPIDCEGNIIVIGDKVILVNVTEHLLKDLPNKDKDAINAHIENIFDLIEFDDYGLVQLDFEHKSPDGEVTFHSIWVEPSCLKKLKKIERDKGIKVGIKEIRKTEINSASIVSSKIRTKFSDIGFCLKDEAITDLRDIYEICSIYVKLVDNLILESTSNEDAAEILSNINNDLYIHLPYHCKSLKKPLQKSLDIFVNSTP